MRIGMVMSLPFPPREGMGFYVWNLSRYLTKQGHTVHIITRGGAKETQHECVDGIHIWRPAFLPVYPIHVHLHGVFVDRLVQQLEGKIDLFHLHTPLVKQLNTRRPTLVTVHTPMKADTGSIPVTNLLGLLIRLQAPVSYQLEKGIFAKAGAITAVASSVAQELGAYAIDARSVHVLGNGVDTEQFSPVPFDVNKKYPYFLTVGRLAPRKGLKDLLKCAAIVHKKYPDYRFLIAGEGPLQSELEHEIRELNLLNCVKLLGHVEDRKRLINLYRGATGYAHAAHYEGLPTALLEAMSCGRPVVTTAVSGALDVIQHGENGLLVPAHAPAEMAKAVEHLITQPSFAATMGKFAHKTIENRYSWHVISRNYVACYESLLQQTASNHEVLANA
ncbi:MAG: glycosyltransferase family 1 protein [Chloroflexi bacterium]|nr:MAG: glycosyltransferase family 1 protein [Chloroflexota bacterium]